MVQGTTTTGNVRCGFSLLTKSMKEGMKFFMKFAKSWNHGSCKTWNRNPEPDYGNGNGNGTWNQISMIVNFKTNFHIA